MITGSMHRGGVGEQARTGSSRRKSSAQTYSSGARPLNGWSVARNRADGSGMTFRQTAERSRTPDIAGYSAARGRNDADQDHGHRPDLHKPRWPGPGSNRRPSAFQLEYVAAKRYSGWSAWIDNVGLDGSEHLDRPVGPILAPSAGIPSRFQQPRPPTARRPRRSGELDTLDQPARASRPHPAPCGRRPCRHAPQHAGVRATFADDVTPPASRTSVLTELPVQASPCGRSPSPLRPWIDNRG